MATETKESATTTMRTVSLVQHIEFEFKGKGNVIPQTMLLADVDNDSANELIVGNIAGDIAIFKGDSLNQPWKKITLSGMLTCLSVGHILHQKKNSLVCMTAEGWCYVYDVSSLSASQNIISSEEGNEKPILTQELPANARVMFLADIDMDGHVEMIIGYCDRIVRAFRWQETHESPGGQFVFIQKWQLAGQIGNITINHKPNRLPELMVSQPGGTFVSLKVRPSFRHVRSEGQINTRTSGLRHGGRTSLERSGSFAGASASRYNSSSKLNSSVHSIDLSGSRDSPGPNATNNSDTISTHSELSHLSLENISLKGIDGTSSVSGGRISRGRLQKSVSDADQPSSRTNSRKGSSQIECSSEEDLGHSVFKFSSAEKLDQSIKGVNGGGGGGGKEGVIDDLISSAVRRAKGRPELDLSFDSEDAGIVYHPVASHTARNENSSTFIVSTGAVRATGCHSHSHSHSHTDGDVQESSINNTTTTGSAEEMCYALATLDGSVVLIDKEDSLLWSHQMDHEVMALTKLDVTGDGKEDVICCSWNGQTYIINRNKEIVCYQFPDSVAAFCAGNYAVQEGSNVPCFVYATTNGQIYIFHDIILPHLKMTNLLDTMVSKENTAELLAKLNIKPNDKKSLQELYRWCLYGKQGQA